MTNFFARQGAEYINELKQSMGALLGIATGLLADGELTNSEIGFLKSWLDQHDAIANEWPGDVIHARINAIVVDGVITEEERAYLVETLQQLVGSDVEALSSEKHVTSFGVAEQTDIVFPDSLFCFTGEFMYGPKDSCVRCTERRGGIVIESVTKKLNYLVVGGRGSKEWKHGSFGTKIQKAMTYKERGARIEVVPEEHWVQFL